MNFYTFYFFNLKITRQLFILVFILLLLFLDVPLLLFGLHLRLAFLTHYILQAINFYQNLTLQFKIALFAHILDLNFPLQLVLLFNPEI